MTIKNTHDKEFDDDQKGLAIGCVPDRESLWFAGRN
jgi:hypothetical protein